MTGTRFARGDRVMGDGSLRSRCIGGTVSGSVLPVTQRPPLSPHHPHHPNNAALREQRTDLHADPSVDLGGDADVGHGQLADDRPGGGSEEPGLGQGQREGGVGADAGIVGIPVAASRPEGRSTARIGAGWALAAAMRRAAGPEGGPLRPKPSSASMIRSASGRVRAPPGPVPGRMDRQTEGLQRSELVGGGACRSRSMAEPDRRMGAPAVQEAGGDHAVATVAAAPGQHEHRLPRASPPRNRSRAHAATA